MQTDHFDIRTLMGFLNRQFWIIVGTLALCLLGAAVYLIVVIPIYSATALVSIDVQAPQSLLNSNKTEISNNQTAFTTLIESQAEIIKSDATLLTVIENEQLDKDPEFNKPSRIFANLLEAWGLSTQNITEEHVLFYTLKNIHDALEVQRSGLTYLTEIEASSIDPAKAVRIANATAQAYIDNQVKAKVNAALAARRILQEQIAKARQTLTEREQSLDSFIRQNLEAIIIETDRVDVSELYEAMQEIEKERLELELAAASASENVALRNWGQVVLDLESEALERLEQEYTKTQQQLDNAQQNENSAPLEKNLDRLEERLIKSAEREIAAIKEKIIVFDQELATLNTQVRDALLNGPINTNLLVSVYEIQQEATIARELYQGLIAKVRNVETEAGLQVANSQLVSPAIQPIEPAFPRRNLILSISALIGLILGGFFGLIREYYIGGFSSAKQLSDAIGFPVATTITSFTKKTEGKNNIPDLIVEAPLSLFSESIRRLRAAIDQYQRQLHTKNTLTANKPHKSGQIILVMSALPEEGKSTIALALARTYAISGKRTLLIDCDLRKPAQHILIGVPEPQNGLIGYLLDPTTGRSLANLCYPDKSAHGQADDKNVVETPLQVVLGAQQNNFATDQFLVSDTFETLIKQAQEQFDIVVIDSAPLLPVVDARYIIHYADAVALVVRWAATSQSELRSVIPVILDAMQPNASIFPILNQQQKTRSLIYQGYYKSYSYGEKV